MQVDAEIIGTY